MNNIYVMTAQTPPSSKLRFESTSSMNRGELRFDVLMTRFAVVIHSLFHSEPKGGISYSGLRSLASPRNEQCAEKHSKCSSCEEELACNLLQD